jgi:REP element-mobilizing transposase RayT
MARPFRQTHAGMYHVYNRGARRWITFIDDHDRAVYLDTLAKCTARYGVEVHAFALMGNHYPLLLRCPDGELSPAMRDLGNIYTKRLNRRHDIDGALFRGRFSSVPIRSDGQLLDASRYIHRNPLDLQTSGGLAAYEWSSYRSYIGRCPKPAWLRTDFVLGVYASDPQSYRRYVELDRPQDKTTSSMESSFTDFAEIPTVIATAPPPLTLDYIDDAVAAVLSQTDARVAPHGASDFHRSLGVMFGFEVAGFPARILADHYGFATSSSVRSCLARGRRLADRDDGFAEVIAQIRSSLAGRTSDPRPVHGTHLRPPSRPSEKSSD